MLSIPVRITKMVARPSGDIVDLKATFLDAGAFRDSDTWICAIGNCATPFVKTHDHFFSNAYDHIFRNHPYEVRICACSHAAERRTQPD